MHIPDGYLSPTTSATLYVASAPFIVRASQKVKKKLGNKIIPQVAVFAAFSFVIMMFNIPLPGGTTGHAVGATISAIVLGPWLSILAVSVALIIQALFFGDGGVLTLGANIFNMSIAMSLSGYFVFQILSKIFARFEKGRVISAGVAGYVAINVAALLTAIELGVQPIFFHSPTGAALYFPYGINVALPAMMIGHLTIAGLTEGFVTALSFSWIIKTFPNYFIEKNQVKLSPNLHPLKKYWFVIILLTLLTPLGLLAPGTAWGEWGREELLKLGLGYVPIGFDKFSNVWKSPLPDYVIAGINPTLAYILSGIVGILLIVLPLFLFIKIYEKVSTLKNN